MRKMILLATATVLCTSFAAAPVSAGQVGAATDSFGVTAAPLDPAAEKAANRARKAAESAERKRLADLRRKYGEGPYPDEIAAYVADKPEALKPLYKTLFIGGERNAVLNFQRLGLAAMDSGNWKDAETAFDGALSRIERFYANNKQAAAARSVFHNEANKDFKGEPYERAMAYYYRGLLYLRAGDYDNARASLKAAEYQDTLSETESFRGDFAIMNYLVGWTHQCQGSVSSADEAFAAASAARPGLTRPAPTDTLLVVSELGHGPIKARDGTQAQKLVFNPGSDDGLTGAAFEMPQGQIVKTAEASNVQYQATTRGGRAIDGILEGKANFKETTGAIGNVAMQASLMQIASGNNGGALGMAGVGMMFSLFSSAAKTQADIRGWDSLPNRLTVGTVGGVADPAGTKVRYLAGADPQGESQSPAMIAKAGSCSIAWSRSQGSAGIPAEAPGEDAGVAAALSRKSAIQAKNKTFRSELIGTSASPALAVAGGK